MTRSNGASGSLPRAYRWNVAARAALAALGGFVFASTSAGALAALLAAVGWMVLAQAVHLATMLGFLVWCAVAMYAFHHGRVATVALHLAAGTAVSLLLFLVAR
jgi:hypothetical protein